MSFGSTGQLYTQITQHAPFQVFLSADEERAKQAVEDGFAVADIRFNFAEISRPTRSEGRILSAERDGTYQINVAIGLGADGTGDRILAHITRMSWDVLGLTEGGPIVAQIKTIALK